MKNVLRFLVYQRYEIFFGAAIFAWQFLETIYIFVCWVMFKSTENQGDKFIETLYFYFIAFYSSIIYNNFVVKN